MTKPVTLEEQFERTLEQDCKQISAKLLALELQQLQVQAPKIPPECSISHPPQGPPSKQWPRGQYFICNQLGHWEKKCVLKDPMQIFQR